MAYPTKFARQFDYQSYQNANPTRPLPGDKVNVDLNYVVSSISEVVEFQKLVQRSDGVLANQSVGLDQLTAALRASIGLATTGTFTSTNNAIARYDGVIGALQNSGVTIDDSNNVAGANNLRVKLTANANYYIATTGSDSNDGRSSGAAFATFAKAVAVLKTLDFNGYVVTVNIADGTYTTGLEVNGPMVGQIEDDDLIFLGNITTPSNVFIQWAAAAAPINIHDGARCKLQGFKVGNGENYGIKVYNGSFALIANIVYGTTVVAHNQSATGTITLAGNLEITGSSGTFVVAEGGNGYFYFGPYTVTLTGAPDFSTYGFLNAGENSNISIYDVIFSGSATGKKYQVTDRGAIVPSNLRDSLPGNAAGTDDSTAKTINGLNITSTTGTITIINGKTLTASNTISFDSNDGAAVHFGAGGYVVHTTNKLSDLAATTSAELAGIISDETGTGSLVFATSPALVTPNIGAAIGTSVTVTGALASTQAAASGPSFDVSGQTNLSVSSSSNAAVTGDLYNLLILSDVATTGATSLWLTNNAGTATLVSTTNSAVWVASTSTPGAGTLSLAYATGSYRVYAGSGAGCQLKVARIKLATS